MRVLACASLGMVLGLTSVLAAQETTGALQGRVMQADGAPAAAVHLVLTGKNLQGARQRITTGDGFYQFLALPPGEYALSLSRIGMRPSVVEQIVVDLGHTTGLAPIAMQPLALAVDAMRIVASDLYVDPVRTTSGGTIRAAEFAQLPTERDFKAIIPILPQVNVSYRGDAPNVAGSTGLENQYFIDGVNVSDTRRGNRATSLPYNFVRAVEVKTGGYEAQFGRATGAVVNAVTYSGTNRFEASAFLFAQPHAFSLRPRALEGVSAGETDSYDVGVRLSGPLVRDRLWYSAALNPRREVLSKDVLGIGPATERTKAVLFASKLTWRASETSNLELTVFGDPRVRDAVDMLPFTGIHTAVNVDPLLTRVTSGGTSASLRGTFNPAPRVLIETSIGRQWNRGSIVPRTARGRDEELFVDHVNGTISGGVGWSIVEQRGRATASIRGTLALNRHTVVAGAEYDDGSVTSRSFQPGLGQIDRYDTSLFVATLQGYSGSFHNRSPAVFLQDTWRAGERLTINAGLRWSAQYLLGASGRTAQRITDEWQPRAGFSWMLDEAGRQRAFGSYGRFYQLLTTNISVLFFVDYPFTETTFSSDPRRPGATQTGFADYTTLESDFAKQVPGLQAENIDEFTVGYERLLGAGSRIALRGIRRALRSSFQWGFNPDAAQPWAFGTPGKGDFAYLPAPKREYTALEVSGEGVWRSVRYRASYVLSRTWGNYSGVYSSDEGFANPGMNHGFWTPNQAVNSTGYLPTDRRHIAKLSGSWTPSARVTAGAIFAVESGTPINDFAAGPGFMGPSFLVPRGSAGRTPSLWNLDLRLAYDLPNRGGMRTKLLADILHLGNPRGTTRVDEFRFSAADKKGVPTVTNARYLQPLGYQPPMAARVGIEVGF